MERLTLHGHVSRMIVIFVVHYDCIITIGIEISTMHRFSGYSVNLYTHTNRFKLQWGWGEGESRVSAGIYTMNLLLEYTLGCKLLLEYHLVTMDLLRGISSLLVQVTPE